MSKGFIKRALPFVGTLVLGLFIASFFVDLSAPRFKGHGRRHEMKRLRMENHELRNENQRLRHELEVLRSHEHDPTIEQLELAVPPPPMAPMPPMPHHPRIVR